MERSELGRQLADQVPGLLRYARSITTDPGRAEDLVQDTLVRALERVASFRGDASLATWLHRILHNLSVDQLRRAREVPSGWSRASQGSRSARCRRSGISIAIAI